jgi:signal peptidase I
MNTEHKNIKYYPRFVGLIMAFVLPGSAHVLSGQRKTGIAWYLSLYAVMSLYAFALSIPVSLSFTVIITIVLLSVTLLVIYFVSLFVSSYRPTPRLGCSGWIIFFLMVSSFNIIFSNFLAEQTIGNIGAIHLTPTSSMYPAIKTETSLLEGDRNMISYLAYWSSDPHRGDIVLFLPEQNDELEWCKRVVGLPGETVDICSPYVLINGEKLLDPPIFAIISSREDGYFGYVDAKDTKLEGIALPITLGPDEYFILGDNSSLSWDSRHFGPVKREAIVGQVTRIIFPPWRIQELTTFSNKSLDNPPRTE